MRKFLALILIGVGVHAADYDGMFRASSALPGVEEAYLPAIAKSSHACNLLQLRSGDLLLTWFTGTAEGQSDVGIAVSLLPAGSSSQWTPPHLADHQPGFSFQNPVPFQPDHGSLWIFHSSQGAGAGESHAHILLTRSTDGGATWSAPATLFPRPGAFDREPLVPLPGGRWLLPIYYSSTDTSVMAVSADHGATWSETPVPDSAHLVQPDVLRLPSGRYVAFFRDRRAEHIYRSDSPDGIHFPPPQPTDLPNNNASIQAALLPDGALALVFNNSPRSHGKPGPRKPLTVALSPDEGRHFPWMRNLETGSNTPGREEYSYPSVLAAADGRVYVAYTYRRVTIKVVRFNEAWLKEGNAGHAAENGAAVQ